MRATEQQQHTQRQQHPIVHDATRHLWEEADRDVFHRLALYYFYRGSYVCPNCRVATENFDEFLVQHHNARAFAAESKAAIFARINPQQRGQGAGEHDQQEQPPVNEQQQQHQNGAGPIVRAPAHQRRPRDTQTVNRAGHFTLHVKSSLHSGCLILEFSPVSLYTNVSDFVNNYCADIHAYFLQYTREEPYKIQLYVAAQFQQEVDASSLSTIHQSTSARSIEEEQLTFRDFLLRRAESLDNQLTQYNERSSGWVLRKFNKSV